MSSIAYVTDQKMIEYHRLCGSREINFWRLSSRAGFSSFHKGDLLFFYARGLHGKKKGLVGYAHYQGIHTMTLKQMWNRYGTQNGYDSLKDMQEAVEKASRDHKVPEKMTGLYLTDVVFFVTPVYPGDVGITINDKLESYTYLDRDDPDITVRILREAEKSGIDIWSASQSDEPEYIFRADELRHQLQLICSEMGKEPLGSAELARAKKLTREFAQREHYEMIRGSVTDCFASDGTTLKIAVPFVYMAKNRQQRMKELLGKITWYKTRIRTEGLRVDRTVFTVLSEEEQPLTVTLLKEINEG